MYLSEQAKTLYAEVDSYIEKEKYDSAIEIIDKVISNQIEITEQIFAAKIIFASLYIDIAEMEIRRESTQIEADKLIQKAFGVFNQINEHVPEASSFIKCTRARGLMVCYDYEYIKASRQIGNRKLTFDHVDSIFSIKNSLSESIKIYWEALTECNDENERYNIRNNLGNALSRAGRSIESLILLRENVALLPQRWQSHVSLIHCLGNLMESALIPQAPSFHLLAIENYTRALGLLIPDTVKQDVERSIATHTDKLREQGYDISEEILELNRKEEKDDIEKHTEYRKFVLFNDLSLSEHSLYCHCRDSAIDNLKIGLLGGSQHVSKPEVLPLLDGLVNRLVSEFSFARLLYYNYVSGISLTINDVEFSILSKNDLTGYTIEQLRTSYRLAYGILDKIKNGVLVLFQIEKDNSYFEDFFDRNKEKLSVVDNRHLTGLYSLALDLNRDQGSFKHYKRYRNEMEHGFLAINEFSNQSDSIRLSHEEMKQLTFDLLKLTRTAIFNFVFLIRTTTIVSIGNLEDHE